MERVNSSVPLGVDFIHRGTRGRHVVRARGGLVTHARLVRRSCEFLRLEPTIVAESRRNPHTRSNKGEQFEHIFGAACRNAFRVSHLFIQRANGLAPQCPANAHIITITTVTVKRSSPVSHRNGGG